MVSVSPKTVDLISSLYRKRTFRFSPQRGSSHFLDQAANEASVQVKSPVMIWQLLPQFGDFIPPSGLVKIKIDLRSNNQREILGQLHSTINSKAISGRLRFAVKGDSVQSDCTPDYIWFSSDKRGRAHLTAILPGGLKDLSLELFTEDRSIEVADFRVQEIGLIQRAIPRVLDLVRYHIRHPYAIISKARRAAILFKRGGVRAIRDRLIKRNNYAEWIALYDTINEKDRERYRLDVEGFKLKPLISILLPVYNVPERYLRQAIESVQRQIYTNWELCIADDNSPNPLIRRVIEEYAKNDRRIKYIFRESNGHISETTNSAATLASGDFLGFLDHDDELREHALYMVARELNISPKAQLIFSDEDKITTDGERHDPYFKSDWNPELLLCHNCVCHFTVIRTSLFRTLGGLRKECDGAQDWDLALRVSESVSREEIRHIPEILYHWRVIDGSTAKETSAKPYVTAAQIKAVSQHLERRGDVGARVDWLPALSMLRVTYAISQPQPLVSLIIPTFNQYRLLSQCIEGILKRTHYTNIEVIVVDNRSDDPITLDYLRELPERDPRVKVIRDEDAFNFSRINNRAAQVANGSILGFINNDIEVVHPGWLDEMVAHVTRKDVAAVGAKLLFPNGTIQHVGVITGIGGVAGHMFKEEPAGSLGYFCRAALPQNLSAVTAACMLARKDLFDQVGGFDEEHLAVAFNDIDLCLKLRSLDKLIVMTPYAELIHHESVSRGNEDTPQKRARFEKEHAAMRERWGEALVRDPYYNQNLTLEGHKFELRF